MKSFDFYDTLFTRLVSKPRFVFQLVEHMLGLPGFSGRREAAERSVTARLGAREISLEGIYTEPSLEADRERGAMDLELRLEASLLLPITQNLERVAADDLVISDMYLPESFFHSIFEKFFDKERRPHLILSSRIGKRKSDGRLWQHILDAGLKPTLHLGDNPVADVKWPARFGIPTEHYKAAQLTRLEERLFSGELNGAIAAGVARGTRLSAQQCNGERTASQPLVDVFASVFAPVIVGFVEYIIADAVKRGISDIFFLARDGQVPFRVAKLIIERRGLTLNCHYLYASRQSLHMAGYTSPRSSATWLLEDTPSLSIAIIATRANLPLEIFASPARQLQINDLMGPIPHHLRGRLIELLEEKSIAVALQQEAQRQWRVANAYFRKSGLRPGISVAIVDVGWNGRIQSSLRSILAKDGLPQTKMVGYYLCLSRKVQSTNFDELIGFLHDPDLDRGGCPFDAFRPVVEASLFADHGSTKTFEMSGENAVAQLGPPPHEDLRNIIICQQDIVLRYTDLLLRFEDVTGYRVEWKARSLRHILLKYLRCPSSSEARAFACHELDIEQVEGAGGALVFPAVSWQSLVRGRSLGYWPEGSMALSGLGLALGGLRLVRLLMGLLRRGRGVMQRWVGAIHLLIGIGSMHYANRS